MLESFRFPHVAKHLRYTGFIQFEQRQAPMSTLPNVGERPVVNSSASSLEQEERRRRRIAALKAAEGLWKHRTDLPKDGVEYQEQLRAEWR